MAINYRARELEGRYFITSENGSYAILSKNEFEQLKSNEISEMLKDRLRQCCIIIDEDNIDKAAQLLRKRYDYLFSGPSLHIIVVTLRCNMNCIYCHASSKPQNEKGLDLDKETAQKTVDFIFQSTNNKLSIEFQGGEPLLNWGIVKYIVEYAEEKNKSANKYIKFSLVTNLSGMDDEKMEFLIKHSVCMCASLDGPKELHDYNRIFANNSNYEDVVNWIRKFNNEYKKRKVEDVRFEALVTLTKKSMDYPKEIIDEYVKLGLKGIHLRFLDNLGVAKNAWQAISYSVDDYLKFWKKAVMYIEELKKKGIDIEERIVKIMQDKISGEIDPNYLELRTPCGAVIGQLTYNYNGDVYSCDEARMINDDLFLLGNAKADSYKDIVTGNKACSIVLSSMNDQYLCNNCAYKPYCGICPVCNYAEHGTVIAQISQSARCKIFKEQFDWVVKEKFFKG
jgi:His-Xaa-Ser system radical SAM maturase HxsB